MIVEAITFKEAMSERDNMLGVLQIALEDVAARKGYCDPHYSYFQRLCFLADSDDCFLADLHHRILCDGGFK